MDYGYVILIEWNELYDVFFLVKGVYILKL